MSMAEEAAPCARICPATQTIQGGSMSDRELLELAWDRAIDSGQSTDAAHRALDLCERAGRGQLTGAEAVELSDAVKTAHRLVLEGRGHRAVRAA